MNATTLRRRHLDFYIRFAEHHAAVVDDAVTDSRIDWQRSVQWMRAELDNIRAAMSWALAQEDHDSALRLATATKEAWGEGGMRSEGRRWLSTCLAARPARDELAAHGYRALGALAVQGPDPRDPDREEPFREALEIYRDLGDERNAADCMLGIGFARLFGASDYDGARELLEEGLAIAIRIEDRLIEADARFRLAWLHLHLPSGAERAIAEAEHSIRLYEQFGNHLTLAYVLSSVAGLHRALNDQDEELRLRRRAVQPARDSNTTWWLVHALTDLADCELRAGSAADDVRPLLEEALNGARFDPNRALEARVLSVMSRATAKDGNVVAARSFAESALELLDDIEELDGFAADVFEATLATVVQLATSAGDLRAASTHVETRRRFGTTQSRRWTVAMARMHQASLAELSGDPDTELDAWLDISDICDPNIQSSEGVVGAIARAHIALLRGQFAQARSEAESAVENARDTAARYEPEALLVLLRAEVAAGRPTDALAHADLAASVAHARGHPGLEKALFLGAHAALADGRPRVAHEYLTRAESVVGQSVPSRCTFVWLVGRWATATGHAVGSRLLARAETTRRRVGLGGLVFAQPTDVAPDAQDDIDAAFDEAVRVVSSGAE